MKKDFKFIFGAIVAATIISFVSLFGYLFPREKLFSDYVTENQATEQASADSEDLSDTSDVNSEGGEIQ